MSLSVVIHFYSMREEKWFPRVIFRRAFPTKELSMPEMSAAYSRNSYPAFMDDWEAILAFTRERQEEIRMVEEEIAAIEFWFSGGPIWQRILARERAVLGELKRGNQR